MIGNVKSIEAVCETVQGVTGMSADVVGIIKQYTLNLDFLRAGLVDLEFDSFGKVTNPEIRQLYKEAFMSSYCSAATKDLVLFHTFHKVDGPQKPIFELRQNEFRKIFDEIAQSGYKLFLDHVCLSGLRLTEMNFSNASLRGVTLKDSTLFKVNLSGADLTGAKFDNCFMLHLNLSKADLTGTDFSTSKQADVQV